MSISGRFRLSSLLAAIWNAVFNPTTRLSPDFPLTGKKLGKAYFTGAVYFFVGSLAPFLLLFVPMLLLLAAVKIASHLPLHLMRTAFHILAVPYSWMRLVHPESITFIIALSATSFVAGFGAQMWYLNRFLKKQGQSLRSVISLDLDSLKGSSWKATLWSLLWRASLVIVLWDIFEHAVLDHLPAPQQATLDLGKQLASGNLLVYFLIVAIGAPILEEVIFRGFLFRGLRASFRQGRPGQWLAQRSLSDLAAVVTSGLIFSLSHILTGSNVIAFFIIFLMGCYMAEVYRRTGTLWTGIIFHMANNAYVCLMLSWHR